MREMEVANSKARNPLNDHSMSQAPIVQQLEQMGDSDEYHYPGGRLDKFNPEY